MTPRDAVINAIWQYDRTLIDPLDPAAVSSQHQENHYRQERERQEKSRNERKWGAPLPPKLPNETRITVRHPLGLPL
jgi:hypothetical protein